MTLQPCKANKLELSELADFFQTFLLGPLKKNNYLFLCFFHATNELEILIMEKQFHFSMLFDPGTL